MNRTGFPSIALLKSVTSGLLGAVGAQVTGRGSGAGPPAPAAPVGLLALPPVPPAMPPAPLGGGPRPPLPVGAPVLTSVMSSIRYDAVQLPPGASICHWMPTTELGSTTFGLPGKPPNDRFESGTTTVPVARNGTDGG